MILTDGKGRPFAKPERADYPDTLSFLSAMWRYRDAVADCANKAFDEQFRKSLQEQPTPDVH